MISVVIHSKNEIELIDNVIENFETLKSFVASNLQTSSRNEKFEAKNNDKNSCECLEILRIIF